MDIYTETGSGSALSDNSDIPPLHAGSVLSTLHSAKAGRLISNQKTTKNSHFFCVFRLIEGVIRKSRPHILLENMAKALIAHLETFYQDKRHLTFKLFI